MNRIESRMNYLKENICKYYVLLDNDDEGRNSIEKSKKSKLLLESEYNLISYEGMKNTELEDAIKKDIYINKIEKEMGIIIDSHKLNGMKNKWSDKMKSIYEAQGKLWSHEIETKIKWIVSSCVDEYRGDINGIINNKSMQSIELLINNLEKANISV